MSLVRCSECGREISDKAEVCPNCGNTCTPKGVFRKMVVGTVGTIYLIFVSLFLIVIDSLFFIFGATAAGWFGVIGTLIIWWIWIKSLKKM